MIFGLNIMWHVVQWMKRTEGNNELIADFPSNPPIFPYALKETEEDIMDEIDENSDDKKP